MEKKYLKYIIWGTVILSAIPFIFYLFKFGSFTFSDSKGDWGTFGDYVGGLLNPFISILTLAVTVYIAVSINEYEKRRDTASKNEEDVKSFLELYQFFTTSEFRDIRHTAWNTLRKAIENKPYKDFIVKEAYVARYIDRLPRPKVYENFKNILYPTEKSFTQKEFLQKESEDRNKLDSLINFFQLLAVKNVPVYYYQICDFYYDSWRPLLCWYAKALEDSYNSNEQNKVFNNPPTLRAAIAKLDEKYYYPSVQDTLTIDNINQHPIIDWYQNSKAKH
jgi:hypothetical protein